MLLSLTAAIFLSPHSAIPPSSQHHHPHSELGNWIIWCSPQVGCFHRTCWVTPNSHTQKNMFFILNGPPVEQAQHLWQAPRSFECPYRATLQPKMTGNRSQSNRAGADSSLPYFYKPDLAPGTKITTWVGLDAIFHLRLYPVAPRSTSLIFTLQHLAQLRQQELKMFLH